jgi:hypothetical protein
VTPPAARIPNPTPALLERIFLHFPGSYPGFHRPLLSLLDPIGTRGSGGLDVTGSDGGFLPRVSIDFRSPLPGVSAEFRLSTGESVSTAVENTTAAEKQHPLSPSPVTLEQTVRRLAGGGWRITGADHIGFNLPWFEAGIHPRIRTLRERLSAACLYHEYPSGEPWDFILPGDEDEIAGRNAVDYSLVRRPKFELVSFGGCSTPLIQFEVGCDGRYEDTASLFPEALHNPEFRNIWIYLDSPYPADVCLVLNESREGDWSDLFAGHRLPAAPGREAR